MKIIKLIALHVTIIERRYRMVRLRTADFWRFSYSRQIQDLPWSTFRRWLEVKVVPQTSARAVCAECWVVYLHTLPPYPKNLSPTPSWGPTAIEWSVSRQAAGSIGFVHDLSLISFSPPPLPPLPRFVFATLYLHPYRGGPLSLTLCLLQPLSLVPLLNLQLFFSIQYSIHMHYCDSILHDSNTRLLFIYFFF